MPPLKLLVLIEVWEDVPKRHDFHRNGLEDRRPEVRKTATDGNPIVSQTSTAFERHLEDTYWRLKLD